MFSRIVGWINDRWPLDTLIRWSLEEEMPGGTSYAYVFGSCVFIVFLLQVITGVWQLLYFVPMIDHAYDSLNYLRIEVPFGWLIHGLHYWGASAMIILVGLHISQVYIWGAYKHPRQLTWLIGVVQLILTLALGFTGPVLPWDERGYWEAEVGTSSAGTVPILGTLARNLLLGGSSLGQLTLSRFFFLHVAVLPGILMACIGLHLVAFRRFGISGPWDEAKRKRIGPFWPDQVFKDAVIITAIFVILAGLSSFFRAPFSGPLDIMETFYVPKPEWYFLFFYQTLKAFHGWLEPVGTIGVPLVLTLLFLFLPFIDRSPERNPARRPTAMIVYCFFVAWVITMAIIGYYSKPGAADGGTARGKTASAQFAPSTSEDPPAQVSASVSRGAQLFNSLGCIACHTIQGRGGVVGPELNPKLLKGKSFQWLVTQIRNPKAHNPQTIMPAFSSATDQQVNDVVDFLLSVAQGKTVSHLPAAKALAPAQVTKGLPIPTAPAHPVVTGPQGPPEAASFIIGNIDMGATIFSQNCAPCHGPQGTDKVPNPGSTDGTVPPLNPIDPELFNKNPQIFVNNIDRFIQHGSRPEGPNPALSMLPFGDSQSLTQQMIANVEAYVLHLNGVDRAQPVHPGIQPVLYFWMVMVVFGLFGLGLGSLWIWMTPRLRRKT
jgi:ubiquinol-cytochrome c reductase cytochrome b subunit